MGVLFAGFVRAVGQASTLAVLMSIVTNMTGGAWWLVRFTPQYFATNGFINLITRGFGVGLVLPNVWILAAFAAVSLILAGFLFRFE